MTLDEKVGQMAQINLTVIAKGPTKWSSSFPLEIDPKKTRKALVDFKVGSVLNTINNTAQKPETWFKTISEIQKYSMDSTRMGIPIIYGIDAIHGTTYTDGATMFPQQITTAASWNEENAYNMAQISSKTIKMSRNGLEIDDCLTYFPDDVVFLGNFEEFLLQKHPRAC